jgi:hypothetical protein
MVDGRKKISALYDALPPLGCAMLVLFAVAFISKGGNL